MVRDSGQMYKPTDVVSIVANNAVYVVEQLNHRVSKWIYVPASATFVLANGNVNGFVITNDGTSGYTTALLVVDGPPGTATANAIVTSGVITGITITNGGTGYITPPNISIISVTGSGATATAQLTNGVVTSIVITNGGSAYVTATQVTPLVVIDSPPTKTRATGTVTTGSGILDVATVVFSGNGYSTPPAVSVVSNTGNSGDAVVNATTTTPWGNNVDGTTGASIPVTGVMDNALNTPTGIAYDGTRLYVTDTNNNRIRTINPTTGAFLGSVGTGGFGDNNFYRPAGIEVNAANSHIVVADEFNHRIVTYQDGDTPIFAVVPTAPTPVAFSRPHGVFYDTAAVPDHFDIADKQTGIISVYNKDGLAFDSLQVGTPGADSGTGLRLYLPSGGHGSSTNNTFVNTGNNNIRQLNSNVISVAFSNEAGIGTGTNQLNRPESVTRFTDGVNYVLVANSGNHRIEVFEENGGNLFPAGNFGEPLA